MNQKIFLSPPHMTGEEMQFIERAFQENYIAPTGSNISEFEATLQSTLNTKKEALALNSGTAAIHIALILAGVTKEHEVLCPNFSFVATVNPILYVGATPVFVGIDAKTWNMCPDFLDEAIKNRLQKGKKPRAIIVAHNYGNPADMDKILALGLKYNLAVIEDAAAALGATYKGKPCGSIGDYGVLSFNGNKIITTSGGGALITSRKEYAYNLATQNRNNNYNDLGYNYSMSNISAGIGLGQMSKLSEFVAKKRAIFDFYRSQLNLRYSIQEEQEQCVSNRWLSAFNFKNSSTKNQIQQSLLQKNIETRDVWEPLNRLSHLKSFEYFGNNLENELHKTCVCLPSGIGLNQTQQHLITSITDR